MKFQVAREKLGSNKKVFKIRSDLLAQRIIRTWIYK